MKKRMIMITPAFSGGSWICSARVIEKLKNDYSVHVFGLGSVIQKIPGVSFFAIPYPRYDRWGYVVKIGPLVSFLWNLPLLIVSSIYQICMRSELTIVNGLTTGLLIAPLAKVFGSKVVILFNGYIDGYMGEKVKKIAEFLMRWVDIVVVNSKGAAEEINMIAPSKKIIINEHFADDIFFDSKLKTKKNNVTTVLYVGRVDSEKLCKPLVDFAKKYKDNNKFIFKFAGVGEFQSDLIDLSKKQKNVFYLGYISSRQKLKQLYADADVLWSYGDKTYLALPAVEGLASGVPIIVPTVSVVPNNTVKGVKINKELVPKGVGWFVDVNDKNDVEKVLENASLDSYKMKSNCRKYARLKYSSLNLERTIERIIKL